MVFQQDVINIKVLTNIVNDQLGLKYLENSLVIFYLNLYFAALSFF